MTTDTAAPTFITVDELAELLRVNPKTVYMMIRSGAVPGVIHAGRALRLNRDVVLAWCNEGQARDRKRRFP